MDALLCGGLTPSSSALRISLAVKFGLGVIAAAILSLNTNGTADAAAYRTRNFLIEAATPTLAQQVGEAAEGFRRDLAQHWLDGELPPWPRPCPIRVISGPHLAAQGETAYKQAPVRDFEMKVVGSERRILDSVLPHEVTHTILATYFGRPLPRWADEGICTTVEHDEEKAKHEKMLRKFLTSRRGIAMNELFLLKEYPQDILPMYAQGYSVCRFLIDQKGPRPFVQFLTDYMRRPSWTENVQKHYGYNSLAELQQNWLAWVSEGSGSVERFAKLDLGPNRRANPAISQVAALNNGPASESMRLEDPRNRVATRTDAGVVAASFYSRGGSAETGGRRSNATASESIGSMAPPSVQDSGPYGGDQYAEDVSNAHSQSSDNRDDAWIRAATRRRSGDYRAAAVSNAGYDFRH